MMEEQLSPLAVAHLLQHTLRSLCTQEDSQWVYAVFWRILPRNYPPPKWDLLQGGAFDRSRGNRRNWILVWEDGFCNFAASAGGGGGGAGSSSSTGYGGCGADSLHFKGLQPELFFKMSHEIYSYGEGLVGKVAADRSHKWVFKEAPENNEVNFLSAWHNPADSQPRTWEAQFQCGIQTIALISVREGVVQLGAVNKVMEDLSYVVLLRKRFSYLESIPGVLLPHPSSSAFPFKVDGFYALGGTAEDFHSTAPPPPAMQHAEFDGHGHPLGQQVRVAPSMSSLEALLSKLPPVGPLPPHSSLLPSAGYLQAASVNLSPAQRAPGEMMVPDRMEAKEEMDDDKYYCGGISERSTELAGHGGGPMSGWYIHAAKPSTDGLI